MDHLNKMNELVVDRRVRPTALLPLWDIAGYMLGTSFRVGERSHLCATTCT